MGQEDCASSSSSSRKRGREDEGESSSSSSCSSPKRFCEENGSSNSSEDNNSNNISSSSSSDDSRSPAVGLVDDDGQDLSSILEEAEHSLENGGIVLDETQQGLVCDVMRSLEEELGVSCSSQELGSSSPSGESTALDIGYLLEASDDELGIVDDHSAHQIALVEEKDLVAGESWNKNDWSAACADLSMEDLQQEWLRRTLETFMSHNSVSSSVAALGGLGPGFEPPTPLLEAGLIL